MALQNLVPADFEWPHHRNVPALPDDEAALVEMLWGWIKQHAPDNGVADRTSVDELLGWMLTYEPEVLALMRSVELEMQGLDKLTGENLRSSNAMVGLIERAFAKADAGA